MTIPSNVEERQIQTFQAYYEYNGLHSVNGTIVPLQPRFDKKNDEYIILWREIQRVFPRAKYIMDDVAAVQFMVDDDFEEIKPERIVYQPGVVLKVIVEHHEPLISDASYAGATITSLESVHEELSVIKTTADMTNKDPGRDALIYADKKLTAMRDTIMTGQVLTEHSIKSAMQEHFDNQAKEWVRNFSQQERIIQIQEEVARKQELTLDRLAIIQGRVQAIFTQTYELHEYPIPRLFIVLPQASRFRDKFGKPFSHQFRLYFLCECGQHTMPEGSTLQHYIHLAKHEGYELNQPTEFFETYGSYVLTMMQMLKLGIAAAGIIIPPLSQLKLVDGIDAIQMGLDITKNSISPLVDETITFLEDQRTNTDSGIDGASEMFEMDKLEVLEGADLRQLESYLKVQDEARVLGNLYRTLTDDGHVKWVCMDHYRATYKRSAMESIQEVIESNNGTLNEQEGKITVEISTKARARQFYEAITKARRVQELEIAFGWDASLNDLRVFAAAVTKANVVSLAVDGSKFVGPALDLANNGRRYNPIIELMCNGRLRSLTINGFEDFFQHVSNSVTTMTFQIKSLHLTVGDIVTTEDWPILKRILVHCPSLTYLVIEDFLVEVDSTLDGLMGKNSRLPRLSRVILTTSAASVIIEYSQGEAQAIEMEVKDFQSIYPRKPAFLHEGKLTKIQFWEPLSDIAGDTLVEILEMSPKLSSIQIAYGRLSAAILNRIVSRRNTIHSAGSDCGLAVVAIMDFKAQSTADSRYDSLITLEFPNVHSASASLTVDMRCFTRGGYTGHLQGVLQELGPSITKFIADSTLDDGHASQLDRSTASAGSKLTWLKLASSSLTLDGFKCIDRIIDRVGHFMYLGLELENLDEESQQEQADHILSQHGRRVTELLLTGAATSIWIPKVATICPTRNSLPDMEFFGLSCPVAFPQECVEWIAAMLSAPKEQRLLTESSSPDLRQASSSTAWKSLKKIFFIRTQLQPDEWNQVITAIDFFALERLVLSRTNFSVNEFFLLADCIVNSEIPLLPLTVLDVRESPFSNTEDVTAIHEALAAMQWKTPSLTIHGMPQLE
ncbi:hypothetical protein EDD11_000839 [Mortierella claussenii]|nr:hypothetical protein EDD11_000839 [Mortierella claussenii]